MYKYYNIYKYINIYIYMPQCKFANQLSYAWDIHCVFKRFRWIEAVFLFLLPSFFPSFLHILPTTSFSLRHGESNLSVHKLSVFSHEDKNVFSCRFEDLCGGQGLRVCILRCKGEILLAEWLIMCHLWSSPDLGSSWQPSVPQSCIRDQNLTMAGSAIKTETLLHN